MDQKTRPPAPASGNKVELVPIHACGQGAPLSICVVANRTQTDQLTFVLLREIPGSRVYLGALCDAAAQVQEWLEVWVQTVELRDVAFSGYEERLSNHSFDQRWRGEYVLARERLPQAVIVTGMEEANPAPVLVRRHSGTTESGFTVSEPTRWRICRDDALLESFGLPRYSTSPFRYLHDPGSKDSQSFISTAEDAPGNSHVVSLEHGLSLAECRAVFNPHAGLIRVMRFVPAGLEDYLQILEGRSWDGAIVGGMRLRQQNVYGNLQTWSTSPKGLPFLLHGPSNPTDRVNEIFFLKLAALTNMFNEVRAYVRNQQQPLLNLSPASFTVQLQEVGDQFPSFWTARCILARPGQAYPLKIKLTDQKYFIRLGRTEPSSFLPEGMGAHSFGIGSIRLRKVLNEADGIVLEGTLVAEDYLALDPHDLLWFKLPLGEERLEFYAHVHTAEAVGPREARFRTVPAKLSENVLAKLKPAAGTTFAKSPYEVWPLLSSPCDLYSLAVLGVRVLLANGSTDLPATVDDVIGLARRIGSSSRDQSDMGMQLRNLLESEPKLRDLVSPHALVESGLTPAQARAQVRMELWTDTIALLLRLFPGAGSYSYCKNLGDVSPLALETVFDAPIEHLTTLVQRLRSTLTPSLSTNEEIAGVVRELLDLS